MGKVNRTAYPELNKLLWDMHCKYITPDVALSVYERRWAFVNQTAMKDKEKKLIGRLVRQNGGDFMPAND
jgi:hypothetical protein